MPRKHIAWRTCVQCQQVRAKRDLIRVVRTPQGAIEIDEKGKAAGRGAYLCRNRSCWEQAIPRQRLDHALKMKLSAEDKTRLLEYGQQLPYTNAAPAPYPSSWGEKEGTSSEKGDGDSHQS